MDHTYFEFIHRALCLIEENVQWAEHVVKEIRSHKRELRFLERFSRCYKTSINEWRGIWERDGEEPVAARLSGIRRDYGSGLGRLSSELVVKIERSKSEINSSLVRFPSVQILRRSSSGEMLIFLDAAFNNVKDFSSYKKGNNIRLEIEMETLEVELACMKNFLNLTANCIGGEGLQELRTRVQVFAKEAASLTFLYWANARDGGMDLMVSNMLQKIQPFTRDMRALHFGSFRYKASKSDEISKFLNALLNNLKDLISYKADKIIPLKKKIQVLEGKVILLQKLLVPVAKGINRKELQEFKTGVHVFVQNTACLTLECWIKASDKNFATKMDLMLSETLHGLETCMAGNMASFFGTRDVMDLRQSSPLLFGETVAGFLDFFLETMANHLKDDFQILWEGLMFLLTFVADPPNKGSNDKELTLVHKQVDLLFREGSCLIPPTDDTKEYISRREVCDFVREIELVNSKIRQLYCKIPDSSSYNFPRIIGRGVLDFLIQNLRTLQEKQSTDTRCLPFAKYKIIRIEEELVSLRPFFNEVLEFQNEHKELNDTWLQVIDLVHLAEHVTNSCFDFNYPIWYHMAYLSNVIDRIKVVKTKIELMNEGNIYKFGVLPSAASALRIISEPVRTPGISEVVVGLVEEANIVIENLTRGHKSLDIVSIVGMAGIGKTTLARKVYGTPLVKCCFNIFAFTSVSKDHSTRRLLLDILSQITLIDDEGSCMTKEDLAHKLWKCLSRQKYLIVLDDIWNIRAWNEVKCSFPDDQNGSRVMLTTRFQNVAMEAQIKCSPYTLSLLSKEKSWELLQKKVFYKGSCPQDLSPVGKLIAKKCSGLPLAVVLIAGVLATKERSLSIWSKISERVDIYLSEEGLMEMLEFSYKHLPGHLKPCLLHFGAFREDMLIPTKMLMQLWIAEGFVHESETMSLVNVAKEYLKDLADRSLIIINGRSSSGGIKTFGVHDVIHKFCQMKARAENFFLLGHGTASSSSSCLPTYKHYRVFLQDGESIVDATSAFPGMHSLLCFQRCNDLFDTRNIVRRFNVNNLFDTKNIVRRFKLNNLFDTQTTVWRFKLVQVLYLENMWLEEDDLERLSLLVHLRHIVAPLNGLAMVPSSVSNLWKLETFVLRLMMKSKVILPETFWKMKSLRHVNISRCNLTAGPYEHDVYPQLNNVESFSSPTLSTGKDLQYLLLRLPALRKMSCHFNKPSDPFEKRVEILDFHSEIESLNLSYIGDRSHGIPYAVIFPSTLKKLKLVGFELPWKAISDISKLPCLEILMLHWKSVVGPRWDTEDVEFPRLKYLKMNGLNLVRWNASPDSFPCLEQLFVMGCEDLVEIPACSGEIPTLKKFEVHGCNKNAASSANQIKDDQMDLGNGSLEFAISNSF